MPLVVVGRCRPRVLPGLGLVIEYEHFGSQGVQDCRQIPAFTRGVLVEVRVNLSRADKTCCGPPWWVVVVAVQVELLSGDRGAHGPPPKYALALLASGQMLMELMGLEPMTSCVQSRCSPD